MERSKDSVFASYGASLSTVHGTVHTSVCGGKLYEPSACTCCNSILDYNPGTDLSTQSHPDSTCWKSPLKPLPPIPHTPTLCSSGLCTELSENCHVFLLTSVPHYTPGSLSWSCTL